MSGARQKHDQPNFRIFGSECLQVQTRELNMPGGSDPAPGRDSKPNRAKQLQATYFHSQIFETVLPSAPTSYSKAPHALFNRASFFDVVLKNNIPR